jgi:hypothetical protein
MRGKRRKFNVQKPIVNLLKEYEENYNEYYDILEEREP